MGLGCTCTHADTEAIGIVLENGNKAGTIISVNLLFLSFLLPVSSALQRKQAHWLASVTYSGHCRQCSGLMLL